MGTAQRYDALVWTGPEGPKMLQWTKYPADDAFGNTPDEQSRHDAAALYYQSIMQQASDTWTRVYEDTGTKIEGIQPNVPGATGVTSITPSTPLKTWQAYLRVEEEDHAVTFTYADALTDGVDYDSEDGNKLTEVGAAKYYGWKTAEAICPTVLGDAIFQTLIRTDYNPSQSVDKGEEKMRTTIGEIKLPPDVHLSDPSSVLELIDGGSYGSLIILREVSSDFDTVALYIWDQTIENLSERIPFVIAGPTDSGGTVLGYWLAIGGRYIYDTLSISGNTVPSGIQLRIGDGSSGGKSIESQLSSNATEMTIKPAGFNVDPQDSSGRLLIDGNLSVVGNVILTEKLDHGSQLTGLGDDDHSQYVLANGTRDINGNLHVNLGEGKTLVIKDVDANLPLLSITPSTSDPINGPTPAAIEIDIPGDSASGTFALKSSMWGFNLIRVNTADPSAPEFFMLGDSSLGMQFSINFDLGQILLTDNVANAMTFSDGTNNYIKFVTLTTPTETEEKSVELGSSSVPVILKGDMFTEGPISMASIQVTDGGTLDGTIGLGADSKFYAPVDDVGIGPFKDTGIITHRANVEFAVLIGEGTTGYWESTTSAVAATGAFWVKIPAEIFGGTVVIDHLWVYLKIETLGTVVTVSLAEMSYSTGALSAIVTNDNGTLSWGAGVHAIDILDGADPVARGIYPNSMAILIECANDAASAVKVFQADVQYHLE